MSPAGAPTPVRHDRLRLSTVPTFEPDSGAAAIPDHVIGLVGAITGGPVNGSQDSIGGCDVTERIPLVDYLVLGDEPHLSAHECTSCGARFFDRRNACASCEGTEFKNVAIAREGVLKAFTIVSFAAPGVPVPFVAGLIDCDGTSVRANVINVEPDADHVELGMPVRFATYVVGTDSAGVEAIGFGFEPVGEGSAR